LEILEWLNGNGCNAESDYYACSAAAGQGHLEVLKWFKAIGQPWYLSTLLLLKDISVCNGQDHIAEWLESLPEDV
jgi:hypothetical protein